MRARSTPKERTLKLQNVKLSLAWDDGQLTVRSLTTGIGHGTIVTKLVVPLDRVAPVQARDLAIKQLPLQIVLVDFLCQGYAVTGPLDLTGALTAQAGDLWHTLAGAGQFRIGAGKVVGSEARFVLRDNPAEPRVWGLDSNSLVRPEDAGAILVTGSHGGLLGGRPESAIGVRALAALDAIEEVAEVRLFEVAGLV